MSEPMSTWGSPHLRVKHLKEENADLRRQLAAITAELAKTESNFAEVTEALIQERDEWKEDALRRAANEAGSSAHWAAVRPPETREEGA